MVWESFCEKDTAKIGETLAREAKPGEIYLLEGDLGVGKTVFAKGFALGLGIAGDRTGCGDSHTESQPDSIRYTAPVCDTDPAGPHSCGHGSTNRDTQELCAGLTESQVRQEQPERDSLQKSKREKGI